jgi:hypothetical protein
MTRNVSSYLFPCATFKRVLCFLDLCHNIGRPISFAERDGPAEHCEKDASQTPDVNFVGVWLVVVYFGCDVKLKKNS